MEKSKDKSYIKKTGYKYHINIDTRIIPYTQDKNTKINLT